jgi:hypothetical protein
LSYNHKINLLTELALYEKNWIKNYT